MVYRITQGERCISTRLLYFISTADWSAFNFFNFLIFEELECF